MQKQGLKARIQIDLICFACFTIIITSLLLFNKLPNTTSTNRTLKVIPALDDAYHASYSVLDPQTNRPLGAATIIKWKPNQKVLALTALHVLSRGYTSHYNIGLIYTTKDNQLKPSWILEMKLMHLKKSSDLALLESINPVYQRGRYVKIGQPVPLGTQVWVIGSPLGQQRTITTGIVSTVTYSILEPKTRVMEYQVNTTLYPGDSGGGVFNNDQELIGVSRAIRFNPIFGIMADMSWIIHTTEINMFLKTYNIKL